MTDIDVIKETTEYYSKGIRDGLQIAIGCITAYKEALQSDVEAVNTVLDSVIRSLTVGMNAKAES